MFPHVPIGSWNAEQDLLDFSTAAGLLSAAQSSLELSGPFALLISFAGRRDSIPGRVVSFAFEPRNFFLAVGGTEPELIPDSPGAAREHQFLLPHPTWQARLLNGIREVGCSSQQDSQSPPSEVLSAVWPRTPLVPGPQIL